ncbi:SusC/RagA family TonB-linked outer membrane protein [Plebeiibacterium sediminum]|uniref:SusC/RagA family TonB-linked outer membrane protein n=1 Tax=Plebeiibacterium sediminum TaxID=2992112 RepID=A0AAE3M7Z3_9BACT|nr:SusC/RagA family TonB-linked outer membrane protein [Plebeiobacterium sediminum]MCW3788936.1 SusC/RagA family TonB-linked outer membrane protein [Plebeiobacterium sediminum]
MKKNPYCHKLHYCSLQKLTLKLLLVISILSYTSATVYASNNTSTSIQEEKKITVTGNVTDQSGSSIPGVTILVKDSSIGTISDIDGNYTLSNVPQGSVLVFSFVGMKSQEVNVENNTEINVVLESEFIGLDEVVAVGYGIQRREDVTSSIASVKAKDFVKVPTPDAAQLVRGQIAGVSVITPDANPLSTSQISLRGVTTLSSGSGPLILIDGIPGAINSVSPNDIEQIDVLKDGSAAAIYGTRGTNGVILITTKKNKGEIEPSIEVNSYISTQKIIKKLPMMTTAQYREKVASGKPGAMDQGADIDWVDEILQTPFSQTYSVNLKGGSSKTSYIASFDYTSNEGIVKRSKVDMIFPRLNVIHRMFDDKLKIDASVSGYHRNYGIPYNNGVYQNALIYNPTTPITDENGNWTESAREMYENPLALLNETKGENKITNLRMYSAVTFSPIEGLDIKYLASRETYYHFSGYYETKQHRSNVIMGKNGYASRTTNRSQNDLMELTAHYKKLINENHSFSVLGGYSWTNNNYQSAFMDNYDFPSDDYSYNNMGLGAALKDGSAGQSTVQNENKLVGYFGRVNYNFKSKYYVSASVRYEGSSKFGDDHKWGTFPAVTVGWNLKDESFLNGVGVLTSLKLRAGFGVTGTEPGSPYLSLNQLNLGGYGYYGGEWVNLLRPGTNPNPDLRWEKKEETNIGLDFGFLEDRISGSIDVYKRDTKDLIWGYTVPVPPYLYSNITANAGSIRNEGIEVALNLVPVSTQDLIWNSNINFSSNRSELIALSSGKYKSSGYADAGNTLAPIQQPTHRIQEGEPIGNFYGYKSIDIDADGHWIIEGEDGNPKPIVDQQPTDKKVLGNGLPKAYVNWNNSVSYKQFDLGVTMRGAFGFQILNMAEMNYAVPVNLGQGNIMEKAYDNVYGKRPLADDQELQYVSHYVQDGDYWKIDNVTIGFSPKLKKVEWIKGLRVYCSVSNLAVFTKYSGIDPEVNVQGLTPGTDDRYRYPSARTYTLGVNLNF